MKAAKLDSDLLSQWFLEVQRPLPWRIDRNPYRIWISEVMLQQTTVSAVVPFYERFMNRFPELKSLAAAKPEEVLEMWAGLGYYSRARNLHKAAQEVSSLGKFPDRTEDLLKLPGFGPYTARAVASLAFGEKVGVLDGNVIRVLSRRHGLAVEWWKTSERQKLQGKSDDLAQEGDPWIINQALMELGATLCSPKKPACLLCPLRMRCVARREQDIELYPLSQPKRKTEYWLWKAHVNLKNKKIALIENDYAPFLRGQWLPPGEVTLESKKPKKFNFRHSITHHDIYIQICKDMKSLKPKSKLRWVPLDEVKKLSPTSLITKVLAQFHSKEKNIWGMILLLPALLFSASLPSCASKKMDSDLKSGVQSELTTSSNLPGTASKSSTGPLMDFEISGQQMEAQYSPSGVKIVYVSWDRAGHRDPQVYEYDMILKKETRLTFQDGLVRTPSYWSEDLVLYTSNTDEIKEVLFMGSQGAESTLGPTEMGDIYLIGTHVDEIKRLTTKAGVELWARKDPWSVDAVFFLLPFKSGSKSPVGMPGLYLFNRKSDRRLQLVKGNFESYFIHKSWKSLIGIRQEGRRTQLVQYELKSKKTKLLPAPSDSLWAVADTPWSNLLLIAEPVLGDPSQRHEEGSSQQTQLSFWDPQEQCLNLWQIVPGRVTHLQASPKGYGEYIISMTTSKGAKIFRLSQPHQTPACQKTSNSSKLE